MNERLALCGEPYHPIRSCKPCKATYERNRRAKRRVERRWGFKGPECLDCGGVRSKVMESGYTDDGQRIRRRVCEDCGQDCASVEVYIHPSDSTFWKLNGERARRKRENDYRRKGKGLWRVQRRWTDADRLDVEVRVVKPRSREQLEDAA